MLIGGGVRAITYWEARREMYMSASIPLLFYRECAQSGRRTSRALRVLYDQLELVSGNATGEVKLCDIWMDDVVRGFDGRSERERQRGNS